MIDAALAAPYRRELIPNEDGTWFARVAELTGCMTEGDSKEEALANLHDAMREWLRVQIEDNESIPLPAASLNYSGKFMVRITRQLHREVAECASREGVSLNAFVSTALARAVGHAGPSPHSYGYGVIDASQILSLVGTMLSSRGSLDEFQPPSVPEFGIDTSGHVPQLALPAEHI